jgi:TetR/AcrR family transcriptional regulator
VVASYSRRRPTSDVREAILSEAARLFGERGYSHTSIDSIAFAAGIRKSSLLYHYRSKERLREAVMENLLERWKEEIPRLLTSSSDGEDRFESTLEAVMDYFISDPTRARICVRESMERPLEFRELIREHLGPYLALVTDYIRWGQRDGIAHEDVDPEAWLNHVLNLSVAMVAFAPVCSGFGGVEVEGALERQKVELIRLTRMALLTDPPA